jgi:hypothetical protein
MAQGARRVASDGCEGGGVMAVKRIAREPMCPYGCDRNLGSCVWEPCDQRARRIAATAARIEHELRTGTGRFAPVESQHENT